MRKPLAAALALGMGLAAAAQANEGMWMPTQLPELARTLKDAGFKGDPRQLADVTAPPLSAVVRVGGGTGAFVSGEGLFTCVGDWTPLVVVAVSAAAMALFVYLAEKKNMAWLESFSIAGSMLIGMAAAVLVRL